MGNSTWDVFFSTFMYICMSLKSVGKKDNYHLATPTNLKAPTDFNDYRPRLNLLHEYHLVI